MKKTISILLIVTMLMSMFVISVAPASAAGSSAVASGNAANVTGGNASVITGANATGVVNEATGANAATAGNKMTAGDATRAAELAAAGYVAVNASNVTSVWAAGGKYYLTESFTVPSTLPSVTNITLDGNGHTLTISGALFNSSNGLVVRNLTLEGSIGMDHTSALNRYIPDGVTVIENFTSSVDITYTTGKNPWTPAGVIYSTNAGSSLTNVLYDGTITIKDSATALVGAAGMVSGATGTTFTNCISNGNIVVSAADAFTGGGWADAGVGGIAGKATGNCTFTNCTNNMNISVNAKAYNGANNNKCSAIGGIAGFSNAGTTYTNCINNGDITLGSNAIDWNVGGITGHAYAGASYNKCANNGDITAAAALHEGVGGILGYSQSAETSFNDCKNTGNISASGASVAGIVGRATGTGVTATNCENTGNMYTTFTAGGFGGYISKIVNLNNFVNGITDDDTKGKITHGSGDIYIGGVCGAADTSVAIKNVINNGDVVGNKANFIGGVGGFIRGSGTFENVTNNGDVTHTGWAKNRPAGVVDELNASKINNVINNGNLNIEDCDGAAGVIGKSNCTDIQNVLNTGSVTQTKNTNFTSGVLGRASGSAVLKNVINQGDVTARYDYGAWIRVAGVIASNDAPAKLDSCENTGTIKYEGNSTGTFVSGFNAISYGQIEFVNCISGGEIIVNSNSSGYFGIGGFRGWSSGKSIFTNCVASADITVTGNITSGSQDLAVGGFLGHVEGDGNSSTFTGCTATEDALLTINTPYENNGVGAFLGSGGATINNSINYSTVTASADSQGSLGGFVGKAQATVNITGSTNYGRIYSVGAKTYIGGLIGRVTSTVNITNSTNGGNVESYNALANGRSAGGFIGMYYSNSQSTLTGCVNNAELITMSTTYDNCGVAGFVGRTNGESHLPDAKITFVKCVNNGDVTVASTLDGKAATDSNKAINNNLSSGGFIGQSNGIHALSFQYCINNGDVIKGAYDKEGGHIGSSGFIGSFRVSGYSWTPWSAEYSFENCVNTGDITSVSNAAGFIGKGGEMSADYTHTITLTNCVNEGTITAPWAGGLISYNHSDSHVNFYVYNSLNAGTVNGTQTVGGISGSVNAGSITVDKSFNIGDLNGATVSNIVASAPAGAATVTNSYGAGSLSGSKTYAISAATGTFQNNKYTSNSFGGADTKGKLVALEVIEKELLDIYMTAGYGFETLDTVINEALLVDFEKADEYSTYSWGMFTTALEAAQTINGKKGMTINADGSVAIITQGQLFKAINDLRYAIDSLILKDQMHLLLQYTINKAEKYLNDGNVYTSASWTKYIKALNDAMAVEAAGSHDEVDLMLYINALNAAVEALDMGGDIISGSDFAMLNGQTGNFYLMSDIEISAPVENFSGKLFGNGHTITLNGCGLFGELSDAKIENLYVEGNAGDAKSIFGGVSGTVDLTNISIDTTKVSVAAIFESGSADANVTITNVFSKTDAGSAALVYGVSGVVEINNALVMASAPTLFAKSNNTTAYNAYLDGAEFYDADASFYDEEDVFASGKVAYDINEAFGTILLVQVLGTDATPVLGAPAVDNLNVVIKVDDEYKNAGTKYDSGIGDVPPMPEIKPAAPVYGSLISAIDRADALNSADYTEATWKVVAAALDTAKKALFSEVQSEIEAATNALNIAVAGLKKASATADSAVDYTKLDAAIAAVDALNASDYTDGSWSMLQAMLEMAKAAKTATSQATVDSATTALVSATVNLTKVSEQTDAPAPETPAPTEPATEDGCGGLVGGAAIVLAAVVALGAGVSFKKKED